jgi:glycerol-3-phosphate acyltransferase PlsY
LLSLFVASVLGYVLGSIPTAYLLVRWRSSLDIRETGSGNVGALNSYEVTRSELVGVSVLAGDLLKGVVAFVVGRALGADGFVTGAVAGTAAVIGHCYPVWLRFKGGRGLATAAGVMLATAPLIVPVWWVFWLAGFGVTRSVNPANAAACLLLIAGYLLMPGEVLGIFLPAAVPVPGLRMMGVAILVPVLVRLIGPVKEYVREDRSRLGQGPDPGSHDGEER